MYVYNFKSLIVFVNMTKYNKRFKKKLASSHWAFKIVLLRSVLALMKNVRAKITRIYWNGIGTEENSRIFRRLEYFSHFAAFCLSFDNIAISDKTAYFAFPLFFVIFFLCLTVLNKYLKIIQIFVPQRLSLHTRPPHHGGLMNTSIMSLTIKSTSLLYYSRHMTVTSL